MLQSYKIPAVLIDKFEEKIEVLNKRAKRIGAKLIEYKRVGETTFDRYGDEEVPCVTVELNQEEELKIEGYIFKAKLQKNIEDTYIYMGDEEVPQEQKDVRICQHCNTNRKRKFYYILQNEEDGSYITVGKSCLKDFIGHTNVEKIAEFFQDVKSLEEEFSLGGYNGKLPMAYSVDMVLSVAYVSIKNRGYVKSSRDEYEEYEDNRQSTKSHVYDIFYLYDKPDTSKISYQEYRDLFNEAMELDDSLIEDMKNFILSQGADTSFMQNLQAIIKDNFVIEKMFGYIVCIPQMYMKAKEKELKEELKAKVNANSSYVGEVDSKIDLEVTFSNIIFYETMYGTMRIYLFVDEDNNQIVWKTGTVKDLEIGDKLLLSAKVKEHTEYKGVKQTMVLRPKFKKIA